MILETVPNLNFQKKQIEIGQNCLGKLLIFFLNMSLNVSDPDPDQK
jgi:hypothetical protein